MIFSDSRYATGNVFRAYKPRSENFEVTVLRRFPSQSAKYYLYTWKEEDRVDLVARDRLGSAHLWWKIMDFNPEVLDPGNIPPGTILRIPNVA